jgi:hypothetical protein
MRRVVWERGAGLFLKTWGGLPEIVVSQNTAGPIRSRCRRGSGGRGKSVSGQAYLLALARLASTCVVRSGTCIFGVNIYSADAA